MKNIARFVAVGMAAVATSATLPAAEVTLTVPAHQTNTVAQCLAAEGKSFSTGDILVKKGPGSITTTSPYKDILGGIQIDEGVFRALSSIGQNELGPNSASIPLTVKSGATAFLQLGSRSARDKFPHRHRRRRQRRVFAFRRVGVQYRTLPAVCGSAATPDGRRHDLVHLGPQWPSRLQRHLL